jgi:Outer membrane protein beta-barrel domain
VNKLAGLMVALLVSCSGQAYASVILGLHGGLSAPSGDLSHSAGNGWNAGGALLVPIDARNAAGFEVGYEALAARTTSTYFFVPITVREKVNILDASLFVRAILLPKRYSVAPYLKFGLGIDNVMPDVTIATPAQTSHASDSHVWGAFHAGAGVTVPVNRATQLYVEGLYHAIESNDQSSGNLFTVSVGFLSRVH